MARISLTDAEIVRKQLTDHLLSSIPGAAYRLEVFAWLVRRVMQLEEKQEESLEFVERMGTRHFNQTQELTERVSALESELEQELHCRHEAEAQIERFWAVRA